MYGMIKRNTKRSATRLVLLAFVFVATSGLAATAAMDHGVKHNCPFYGVSMQECAISATGAAVGALHHLDGFKSVIQNTFTAGVASLLVLALVAAAIGLLFGFLLPRGDTLSNRLVLQDRSRSRPPSFFKFQRWLVLHSKRLIPDPTGVLVYTT